MGPYIGKNFGLGVSTGVSSGVRACTTATPVIVTSIESYFWSTAKKASSPRVLYTWELSISLTGAVSLSSGVSA